MKYLSGLVMIVLSLNVIAREFPLNWKNPIECQITNDKVTTKTLMDINKPTGSRAESGMSELFEKFNVKIILKMQASEWGQGRNGLIGENSIDISDSYKLYLSLTIDPTLGPQSKGDALLVNSFLINKEKGEIVGVLQDSSTFNDIDPEGNTLLSVNNYFFNNEVLSKIMQNGGSLKGRRFASFSLIKKLVENGELENGIPLKITVNCKTENQK